MTLPLDEVRLYVQSHPEPEDIAGVAQETMDDYPQDHARHLFSREVRDLAVEELQRRASLN